MSDRRVGIVIQARIGSTRLPGKILMPIGTKSLLGHILCRLMKLHHPAQIVIATSDSSRDDIVKGFCESHSVACYRGSDNNVLDRYYQCAVQYGFHHIVRLTGDNPFLDTKELDNLVELHISGKMDYTNSFAGLPIGVGAEIFTFEALERSWREGKAPHHIEHVNEYMIEHPDIFRTASLSIGAEKSRPDVRLTVDTKDDYERACYIVEMRKNRCVSTRHAIQLAEEFSSKAGSRDWVLH